MCMEVSRISSLQRWRLRGIYSPFEKLAVIEPLGIPNTSGISIACIAPTVTKSVALWGVVTPDDCWNFRLLELLTFVGTLDEPNREHQEDSSGWENTRHVRYCQTQQKQIRFFGSQNTQTSHRLAWALMNNYLSTWCIPLNSMANLY